MARPDRGGPDSGPRVVWSDGDARVERCRACGAEPCRCADVIALAPGRQRVVVRRERAGRKGKTVTVAAPLFLARDDAAGLVADLKRRCGAGGTLRDHRAADGRAAWSAEIQGDRVDAVVEALAARGFGTRRGT